MTPQTPSTTFVPLGEIDASNRLRPVSEAGVESIIASVTQTGVMKDPVHLRRKKAGQLVLIAGGHRLEAARRLGWATIEARIWAEVTDDWCRLMEVDDNLAGADLTPLDTAIFLAQRKAVYERLHPESKAKSGAALAAARWNAADIMSVASFAKVTAEKFGINERHVRRLVAVGSKLSGKDVQLLRSAPKQVNLKDLQDLAGIGDTVERYDVVEAFASGRAAKISEAIKARKAREAGIEPVLKDPVDEAFKALSALWARAPMAAKRRFLDEHTGEIVGILEGGAA